MDGEKMANAPARQSTALTLAELKSMVMDGDFSKLSKAQRDQYIELFCAERGLDWKSGPFKWLMLNGKLVPYATRDCADQLRRINGVSIAITAETYDRGLLTVHVRATDKTGRTDEDYGTVPWSEKMAPEFAANMKLKAVTKAKRRVTLSISGLGWLDETEVEDIPAEAKTIPHREPESGPTMTRTEAIAFCHQVVKAVQSAKTSEQKQMAQDMAADELQRISRNFPDVYHRMVDAIAADANESGT
jgi:hypothetical protein